MFLLFLTRLMACVFLFFASFSFAQKIDNLERPLGVIVQSVAERNLQNTIEALGNLHANESVALTAKVTQTVARIHFDDGQRVTKGTVLVEMMSTEQAALMEETRLVVEEAKRQLERTQALAKTGAVSQSMLDQLAREYTTARARYTALESRFKDMSIVAPFNGVMGICNVSEGTLISPGQLIATLNDDSRMKLDFTVPALHLNSLRKGLTVEAKSHDLADKIFNGEVFSIDNQVDESTRSVKVRAYLDNSHHELKQGLLMSVVMHTDLRKSLVISEAALVPVGSNNFVFVLQPAKDTKLSQWIAERRQIKIGQRDRGQVEVVSGLIAGEKVVTHGLQKIHADQAVSILAEESNDPNQKSETLSELLQQKQKAGK